MARSHGRIMSAIWTDSDFTSLESEPQRLYLFLLSQPDLSHAGLLPLRVRRWASKVNGQTIADVQTALGVLSERRFVLVDEDTEELLIRTLVRNDGVYKQPKVMLRMREDAKLIESKPLREAFLVELDRLPLHELSDIPGGANRDQPSTREVVSGVVAALRTDFGKPSVGVPDTHAEGYAEPTYVRAGALPLPPSPSPQPPTPAKKPSSADADGPTFEDFWKLYPRKVEKIGAKKAWPRAVKAAGGGQVILDGLRRQLPTLTASDPQFVPHPTTWLNNGRWEDAVEGVAADGSLTPEAVDQILGRETFQLPVPPEGVKEGTPEWRAWALEERDRWREARARKAADIQARRAS
jgi:hypothetical protein